MKILFILLISVTLMSCASNIKDYEDTRPSFKLEQFFEGELFAYGIIQDRSGKVRRRFTADLEGRWEGNEGILEEYFSYDDGEQQTRIWYLEKTEEGKYIGSADDVVKPAKGETSGFAFNWHYTLAVDIDGKEWTFKLNDWLYLIDDKRLINRATMRKFGLKVGEITLVIEKK